MSNPSRRNLLIGSAVASAAIPVSTNARPHLDAQLLRLNVKLHEAWTMENHLWSLAEGEDDDDGPLTTVANNAGEIARAVVTQIENQVALTLDGLLVKMRAVSYCRDGEPFAVKDFEYPQPVSSDLRVMISVLADLSRMAGSVVA